MLKTRWLVLPLLIGLVTLPRISIDLYLPAMPSMTSVFGASDASMQMTLTLFMLGYALSMLIAGPLSDTVGKKSVLCFGLGIYLLATFACLISSSTSVLISARFFQALGGCCGTVVARVMVKDSYRREDQIHILAYLSAAMAVSPLFIPILGGYLQSHFGWRSIFGVLAVVSFILLLISKNQIRSTSDQTIEFSGRRLVLNYKMLLQNRLFIGYSLAIGFVWANYFAFTVASPFFFQETLGLSPLQFGFVFSFVVLGYLLGTILTKRFANRVGWDELILLAACICFLSAMAMSFVLWIFPLSWLSITFPMLLVMVGVGIIIPCTQAAVMQPFPEIAGTASGLFFFIQMLFGTAVGFLLQSFSNQSPIPMALIILISSALLFVSFYALIWRKKSIDIK